MSESIPAAHPTICLSMMVRNAAHMACDGHLLRNTLDSVAQYISTWVIVDTGSNDRTQDLVENHMASLGIPGELFERPWRNFGDNRTEALNLAKSRGDYIWVVDADEVLVGTPDFTQLSADAYRLRYRNGIATSWRTRLFRNGMPWHYEGFVYETPACGAPHIAQRLEGEYSIESHRADSHGRDPQKSSRELDLLLAEVLRTPEDLISVSLLAQRYFDQGDFANARKWYARRLEMGTAGSTQDVFLAMYGLAQSMVQLGEPWPDIREAYLRAWACRPIRAEPLYQIAAHYRIERQFLDGYLFAAQAAEIPVPDDDSMVDMDVYSWRAVDEQAICASWIGKHAEAFSLCRRLVSSSDTPDNGRQRIAGNRDFSIPAMLEAASSYPAALAYGLDGGAREAAVTVSLIAGPNRAATELTLNSFLKCCLDAPRVGRFLVVDAGLSAPDRAALQDLYGFLEFIDNPHADSLGAQLARLRSQIGGRLWLHLGQGWRFFAPDHYIARLSAVLDAEPQVFQVGINFGDADKPTGSCASEQTVRRKPVAGRYVITDIPARGPAMFDTARFDLAGDLNTVVADPVEALGRCAAAAGLRTASLDEVLCQGPSGQATPAAVQVGSSAPKVHRFCITHVEPLIPKSWYDDCIALGNYQTDSISHVSRFDQFWHEARPTAYGVAGGAVLPIAVEKLSIDADLIEISLHRKRILLSPVGVRGFHPGSRELDVEECRGMPELASVIVPPSDSGFLVSQPLYREEGMIEQYAKYLPLIDFFDYTSIAVELGVLDNRTAREFHNVKLVVPGGVEFGIYPKSWLVSTLSSMEPVNREFIHRHGDRVITYESYKVRTVSFLSECLGGYLLIRHLNEIFSGVIPAEVFGHMTCVVEVGQTYRAGLGD